MGIQKSIELPSGIELNYWRINSVTVDIECNHTKIRVGGYTSKSDALAGKKAVHSYNLEWVGSRNPIGLLTDPRDYQTLLYTRLTELAPAFAPANPLAGGEIVSDLPD